MYTESNEPFKIILLYTLRHCGESNAAEVISRSAKFVLDEHKSLEGHAMWTHARAQDKMRYYSFEPIYDCPLLGWPCYSTYSMAEGPSVAM